MKGKEGRKGGRKGEKKEGGQEGGCGWPHHLATLDTLEEEAADVQVQLIEHREEISLCRSHKDCGNVWVEAKQSHCQHC